MEDSSPKWGLDLPEATEKLRRSHLRKPPTWTEFMDEIEQEWQEYMRKHDSPELRLRSKNPVRFTLS